MNKKVILISSFLAGSIVFAGLFLYYILQSGEDSVDEDITSFDECVEADYPVMESYPRQCSVPGGETFTEEIEDDFVGSNGESDGDSEGESICDDLCGDGTCQRIVCLAEGCPCAETEESCPEDCANDGGQVGVANPASVYREEQGGDLEIRETGTGQVGY